MDIYSEGKTKVTLNIARVVSIPRTSFHFLRHGDTSVRSSEGRRKAEVLEAIFTIQNVSRNLIIVV